MSGPSRILNVNAPTGRLARERASVAEWMQTALLVANLIWTTLCLGGYRAETMLVTAGLTGSMMAVHFAACAAGRQSWRACDWAGWYPIPFLVYALINVLLVTPVRWLGWLDWLAWANMIAVFWVVRNGIRSSAPRRLLFFSLVALGIFAVLLAGYQRFVQPGWLMLDREQVEQFLGRASGPFGIPNSLAGFLLLLLPAANALAFRRHASAVERVWWSWATLVLGFGLVLTVSRGGWIALGLALVVWPFTAGHWKWQRRLFAALLVLALLAVMSAVIYRTAPAMRERFARLGPDSGELSRPILWRAAWAIFRAEPVTGAGAGSYNVKFEQHRPERFRDEPQWAHNEYLNTLSDYGAVGFVLFFGAGVALVIARCRRRPVQSEPGDRLDDSLPRHGLAIGILAFALQMFVDFHCKIPALAMTFAVVAALALGPSFPRQPQGAGSLAPSRAARVGWLMAAVGAAVGTVPAFRLYSAEARHQRARQVLDHYLVNRSEGLPGLLNSLESDLRRATALAPGHAGAWADLAHVIELRALADPNQTARLGALAEPAATRAIELGGIVAEFWMRLGVALDMQGRRPEAEAAFGHAVRLAPRHSHPWYYYAFHFSSDTERRDEALRAIATCLSLDPGNAAAEALRVKLNERRPGAPFIP